MPAVLSDSGRMDGVSLGHCLSCLTSLVATPASTRPNCTTDSEEDTVNGGIHTFNQTHMMKAFQLMNDLRSKKMLCDVQLVAGSVEVPAHRVVLSSCSPYFCAMFTGDMSESKAHQVEIREVDGQTLRKLVDYIYTAEIEVTEDNVQVLLPAASLLQLMDVRQVCCEFLQSQLHPTNCLGIRAFADLHTCTQLLSQAHAYAEQYFSEVVQGEEFLGLSLQQVSSLISSDRLTVSTEEKVFEAMISWIKYDKPTRLEYMPKLMEHVRLPLLSRDYLVKIVEEEALIKNNNTCKDFLIEAMKYHLLPADQRHLIKTDRTRPRTPVSIPKVMIVVGGQAPKAIRSVECYDFQEDRWYQVADLPSRRCRAGVVSMAGQVFAVGGFNSSLRERTVDVYDGARDQWSAASSMQERRSTLGAAVVGDLLYAVGGFNGSIGLSTVEVYSYKSNEWIYVASMNTRRSSVGVGVVDGKLYAVGGYDGASRQCLSTVEEYDPVSDQWCYVADMSTRRSGAGVGVLGGLLYAAGGHDGPLVRKSVEVYDPLSNAWRLVSDMNMCRRNAGVCAINGLLYVIGGDDGSCNLSSVEFYNPVTDKWSLIPTNMSNGRSYAEHWHRSSSGGNVWK
ncbi:kelch-like protein 3 isoform X1 [Girardinichthys multiradiatus]|uniref:kelch-like protein 3 isoform X1 n=1 Tax=Girardinichthys multiradiatus TaxID=208333 RepID=UPI001FADEDDC|nr:kelch-like protein 3 isoform X1 [Girardinichthys multiradiatus]